MVMNVSHMKKIIKDIDETTQEIDKMYTDIAKLEENINNLSDKKEEHLDELKETIQEQLTPINCEINMDYFCSSRCLILVFKKHEEVNVGNINAIANAFNKTLNDIGLKTTGAGIYVHIYF